MHIYASCYSPLTDLRQIMLASMNIYGHINKPKRSMRLCTVFQNVLWIKQFYTGNIEANVWLETDHSLEAPSHRDRCGRGSSSPQQFPPCVGLEFISISPSELCCAHGLAVAYTCNYVSLLIEIVEHMIELWTASLSICCWERSAEWTHYCGLWVVWFDW